MKYTVSSLIVTFFTTAEAMATQRICMKMQIPGKLISVPRALTADCGIAWASPSAESDRLRDAIKEAEIEVSGFYEMEV